MVTLLKKQTRTVAVRTAANGMPVLERTEGLTTMMYAVAMKDEAPAMISLTMNDLLLGEGILVQTAEQQNIEFRTAEGQDKRIYFTSHDVQGLRTNPTRTSAVLLFGVRYSAVYFTLSIGRPLPS
jgi:hypothetical protein